MVHLEHKATITNNGRFEGRPYFFCCSCGTEGDFATLEELGGYALNHMKKHFGKNEVKFQVQKELAKDWESKVGLDATMA